MNNEIIKAKISMTTIEIAEMTGKSHQHVKRDAEKMFEELSINPVVSRFGQRLNESMDLFTATDLLKKFECTMATNTFNQNLYNMGYMHKEKKIEKHPRASNLDRIYGVRVLSGKGLRYGKNIEIGSHEGLHPRYYENTFMELFGMVTA